MSAANAIKDHIVSWKNGTKEGEFVSMGVYTDGTFYDLPAGYVFSVPVKCKNFEFSVVKDLELDPLSKEKLNISIKEL